MTNESTPEGGPPTPEGGPQAPAAASQTSAEALKTPAAPPRTPVWRHIANGAALVGFLVVGGIVVHTAPTEEQWQAPIAVTGAIGQTLTGRNIQATVTDIRVADSVTASNGWSGETSGVWVVVDASVEAVVTDYGASLSTAQLKVGDTLYGASERPDQATIEGVPLSVGLPNTGPLMFEVPADALAGDDARDAEVQLAATSDPRTDSMIVVPVDLSAIARQTSVTTEKPTWGDG
ncbi:hypothetical protein [Subtercola boreus]|uniref:DUF4352 domain-containing protein n=1 Tax=Subtercola boreus TaxID=120213 RepID=A0A3E0WCE9_9MICO|nr:hypothetical protein [Subtercola boreus]RFA21033.1 hypothetical protein B7R24_06390 [Subtercola boreus]RFA21417.1 hypothetical protein B7R23_06335 [Subtercola boreus]RFA27388.1 hypothetical protein B7R25_06460 [Subtercola boreus]